MRPSLRFLALVAGWVGVRAAGIGLVPGSDMFTVRASEGGVKPPPISPAIVPTEFPPLAPPTSTPLAAAWPGGAIPVMMVPGPGGAPALYYYPAAAPAYYPPAYRAAAMPVRHQATALTDLLPEPEPAFFSPIPQLEEWPLSGMAATSFPIYRSATSFPQQSSSEAARARLDRLQMTTWALLRGRQGVFTTTPSLASGGTLGGSQAGARLTYQVTPAIAASLRFTSETSSRGGEVAGGVRLTPFRGIPVALTAERRQAIGAYGGRSDFALFVEGGLYQRPLPWQFSLDAYAQAGVVGLRARDKFVDGGLTVTRPLFGQFAAGLGFWGAAQPGVYRIDAGPRLSLRVRHNMRVHLDWRQRLAGQAEPGSGPALTLAADF